MTIKISSLAMKLCLIAFLVLPVVAEAQFTEAQFEQILADVIKSAPSNRVETDDGPVSVVTGFNRAGGGSWEVAISYVKHVSEYTVQVVTYPGDLKLMGNTLEYDFEGPTIYFGLPDLVFQEKGFQKAVKTWVDKNKDVNLSVQLDDDRVVVKSKFDLAGVNQGKVADFLKSLFVVSNGVIWWSDVSEKKVEEKYVKDLAKKKLDYMIPVDFENLASVSETVDREGVKEGAYNMNTVRYIGRRTGLNYGDHVVLEFRPAAGTLTDEERAALVPTIEKWLKKNKLKRAETAVQVSDGEPNELVVTATIQMDGKIKGKDFEKLVDEFLYEWSSNLQHYAVYEPGIKQKWADFKPVKPEKVDNKQLFLLLEDIDIWQEEAPEGALGHWRLVYNLYEETETRQYLTNYGDRLVFTYGKPIDKSADKVQAALQKAKAWVAGNPTPHATSTEVALVKGEPQELRMTATIPVGQLTAEELSRAYYQFRSTYSDGLDEVLNELLEIYAY